MDVNSLVFAPKFRRKMIYRKLKADIAQILSILCKRKGVKIVEAEMCPDHVHIDIPKACKFKIQIFCPEGSGYFLYTLSRGE